MSCQSDVAHLRVIENLNFDSLSQRRKLFNEGDLLVPNWAVGGSGDRCFPLKADTQKDYEMWQLQTLLSKAKQLKNSLFCFPIFSVIYDTWPTIQIVMSVYVQVNPSSWKEALDCCKHSLSDSSFYSWFCIYSVRRNIPNVVKIRLSVWKPNLQPVQTFCLWRWTN